MNRFATRQVVAATLWCALVMFGLWVWTQRVHVWTQRVHEHPHKSVLSSFQCTNETDWRVRSCQLRNVCLRNERVVNPKLPNTFSSATLEADSRFLYFYDRNKTERPPVPLAGVVGRTNDPRNPFAVHLVDIDNFDASVLYKQDVYMVNKTTLLAHRHSAGNPGHLIIDLMFPLFMLEKRFRRADTHTFDHASYRILVNDLCQNSPDWNNLTLFENTPKLCEKFTSKYLALMSTEPLLYSFDFATLNAIPTNVSYVCFNRLLVGSSAYGAYTDAGGGFSGRGKELREFRDWFWFSHSLNPFERSSLAIIPTILIHRKIGRRTLNNTDELASEVKKCVGDTAQISVVDIGMPTLPELLRLLSQTAIFITPPGSAAMTALLMAERSTLLTAHFYRDAMPSSYEFKVVFNHLIHVKSYLMPSSPVQYGPGRDDYNAKITNFDKVCDQVTTALQRWRSSSE